MHIGISRTAVLYFTNNQTFLNNIWKGEKALTLWTYVLNANRKVGLIGQVATKRKIDKFT